MYRTPMGKLRKEVIGDSVERQKALTKLIKLVREDERMKTLASIATVQARAERDHG